MATTPWNHEFHNISCHRTAKEWLLCEGVGGKGSSKYTLGTSYRKRI